MLGLTRNLTGLQESRDIPRAKLAATYLRLRSQRALGRHPRFAYVLNHRIAYTDYATVIALFEEIYLRRHYPFRPTREKPLVIDCGANIGLATLFFKEIARDARVLAFEPEPTAFRLLSSNVSHNMLADVQCFEIAVAAKDGRETLRARAPGHGGASIRLGENVGWAETTVTTRRLSSYITDPVDLLKLDIEGAEGEVIDELADAGALGQIANIVIEHHPGHEAHLPQLLARLEENGFRYRIAVTNDRFWDEWQQVLIHAFRAHAA